MKKSVLISALICILSFASFAQRGNPEIDFEKFKSQKIAFITEKLNLTPKEAQEFWPVYNQFEKERMDLQMTRRELEEKTRNENVRMSDQEIIKTTRSIAETFKKEAELTGNYNERFLKILPPQKVLSLYRAENQFRAHMFEQYRKRRTE
jgi:Skp family chaperone for outer membrane proteins